MAEKVLFLAMSIGWQGTFFFWLVHWKATPIVSFRLHYLCRASILQLSPAVAIFENLFILGRLKWDWKNRTLRLVHTLIVRKQVKWKVNQSSHWSFFVVQCKHLMLLSVGPLQVGLNHFQLVKTFGVIAALSSHCWWYHEKIAFIERMRFIFVWVNSLCTILVILRSGSRIYRQHFMSFDVRHVW